MRNQTFLVADTPLRFKSRRTHLLKPALIASGFALNFVLAQTVARPDALLAVDMNRGAVVEKIIGAWRHEIPTNQISALQDKLSALRADELLSASLSGSFDGVLEVLGANATATQLFAFSPAVGAAKSEFATRFDTQIARPNLITSDRAKAVGEAARDLVYTPITPCRLFDTRVGQPSALGTLGGPFTNQETRTIAPGIKCGLPPNPVAGLFLTFHAYSYNPPVLGILGFMKSGTPLSGLAATWTGSAWVTGTYITETDSLGNFDAFLGNGQTMSADIVVDVIGYFQPANRNGDGLRVSSASSAGLRSVNMVNGSTANSALLGIAGATIAGGGAESNIGGAASPNTVSGNFGTVGGGRGNTASSEATVAGGRGNNAAQIGTVIGGGLSNGAGCDYATVGGGQSNNASGCWAAIAGGRDNVASSPFYPTVGGGRANTASGDYSVASGGFTNTAAGNQSTIAGGGNNSAAGGMATVGGGSSNSASGLFATVPGGTANVAGNYSFAAGARAKATHDNTFVWGGNSSADTSSTGPGSFMVYAPSSATIATASGTCTLTNSTGWTCTSDRNLKTAFSAVSPRAVLQKLITMPVTTWSMLGSSVRQMGPTAQDFARAFGLGANDTAINQIDSQGVAFAAIQGLNQKLIEESAAKNTKISALEKKARELDALKAELNALKKKLGL